MIKRRTRPQPTQRERSLGFEDEPATNDEEAQEGDEKVEYVLFICVGLLSLTAYSVFSICICLAYETYSVAELIELRKLRRSRQGIDAAKLTKGDAKKRKRKVKEEEGSTGGLKKGADVQDEEE